MESICPIDSQFSHEISALLEPPSAHQQQEYFDNLIRTRQCRGLKVRHNGELGKGVYADSDFGEGELVLKDHMLVGAQHSSNKINCLVCSYCFCFIGSIELQIGRRLYLQGLGVSTSNGCGRETFSHNSHDHCQADSSEDEDYSCMEEHDELGECTFSSSKDKVPLPEGVAESLMNGESSLPYSEKFPLPSTIACPGGCGEAYYCSKLCAESDWESSHSLLCTGEKSESICREALSKFIQHANETNDIFLLAAKVICFTISRYKKLKTAHLREQENYTSSIVLKNDDLPLLLEAWKPISMGYKKRWWDCITLPDDVDSCDENAFRAQIKELAFTSLKLLKEAIFCKECEPLYSLEIYGHIIGMFELNNLDLVVASPVEDYFLYIDDLAYPEKKKAEEIIRPFLDALGDDYSVPCQGEIEFQMGFCQKSCMNHSCYPNAKAFKREEDRDGQATIIALRPICIEEEVTISYIDEDLPFDERQSLLADYGFRCKCPKCLEEEP